MLSYGDKFSKSSLSSESSPTGAARLGQFFARKLFVALSGVVYKGGDDGRDLFQVVLAEMIVGIHIGMVGARTVFDLVLDELEAGQPYCIERLVVCPTGVAYRDGGGAQVMEGL